MTPLRSALSKDLLSVLVMLLVSLAVLPGLIFLVGGKMFGPYQGGMSQLYQHTLQDLLKPTWAAWILAVGPALCVLALRWIWRRQWSTPTAADPSSDLPSSGTERREPTL